MNNSSLTGSLGIAHRMNDFNKISFNISMDLDLQILMI